VVFGQRSQSLDRIIGRLIGNIGVFLQHQRVVFDGVLEMN
jgi:hypothetical protein